jgi:hypothetical protein
MGQQPTTGRVSGRCAAYGMAVGILLVAGCSEPAGISPLESAKSAFDSGQWTQAIADCSEAIRRNPQDGAAYLLRGRAYHCLGRLDPAILDFSEAIELKPDDAEAYYQRANAYGDGGETALQLADEKRGRELDPAYQQAYLFAPSAPIDLELPEEETAALRPPMVEKPKEAGSLSATSSKPKSAQRVPADRSSATEALFGKNVEHGPQESKFSAADPQDASVTDAYGTPLSPSRSRTEEMLGVEIPRSSLIVDPPAEPPARNRQSASRRGTGDSRPLDDDVERRSLEESAVRERQRAAANQAAQSAVPVQRPTNPYGATQMRPTGVPTAGLGGFDEFEAELLGTRAGAGLARQYGAASGGYSVPGRQSGNPAQYGGAQYGSAGRASSPYGGNRGPTDPYGGYTRSSSPYGAAGGRTSPSGGRNPYNPAGGAQGPYTPVPSAPVPYVPPAPGLRYD